MTVDGKVAVLEERIANLKEDLEEVKAVALGNQRMLRWAMGAAAAAGSLMPVVLPKVAKAVGLL